ncbi:MAG TPA: dephospho-CoA kinase [Burkholderiales bacterium]
MSAKRAAKKFIVGLTGGIGTGKSAAAEAFARLGATVVDTDAIAHELTGPAGAAMPAVAALFGHEFVLPSGAMDRGKVRARVFADPQARRGLEALLHPMIRKLSQERIAAAGGPYVIHVVPLLVESPDYRSRVDRVLVVDASEATQLHRVRARGLSDEEAKAIIASQASRNARLAAADDVIANDGTLDALRQQVADLHLRYAALAAQGGS